MKQDLHPVVKVNWVGKLLVTLVATDHRDVRGWAEVLSHLLLLGMVGVNVLIATVAWYVSVETFFPDVEWWGQVCAGLVGGLLIGFIDWMIVSSHPSLPGWFVVGGPPPRHPNRVWWVLAVALLAGAGVYVGTELFRPLGAGPLLLAFSFVVAGVIYALVWAGASLAQTITDNRTSSSQSLETSTLLPRMPEGPNRAAPFMVRLLLAAFIGLVALGPALNIAMNKEAVQGERVKEEIARVQKGFDEEADRARAEAAKAEELRAEERALQDKKVEDWETQLTTLQDQVTTAEDAVVKANAVMIAAEVKYKCELGEAVGAQCNGISPSSGAGRDRAADVLREARSEWGKAIASRTTARDERDLHLANSPGRSVDPTDPVEPAVPVEPVEIVARAATVDDIDPARLSGLQVTFRAWDALTADWGWGLKYGPGIAVFVFDVMPVLFKLLMGYLRSEQRAWTRQGGEVLSQRRRLESESRTANGDRERDEVKLESELETVRALKGSSAESAQIEGQAAVAATGARMSALKEANQNWATHFIEMSALDVAHDANQQARRRTSAKSGRGTHDHDASDDGYNEQSFGDEDADANQEPAGQEEARLSQAAEERRRMEEDPTPPEGAVSEPGVATGESESAPVWTHSAADSIPADSLIVIGGESYLLGPAVAPTGFARSDVRLAVRVPSPGALEIPAARMASKCVVVKSRRPPTTQAEWDMVLKRHNDLPKYINNMPEVHGDKIVDHMYHPRNDLERHLGQLAREQVKIPYSQVIRWARDLLRDLKGLHDGDETHNDLKARNVIVTGPMAVGSTHLTGKDRLGDLRLIDFDSVNEADAEASGTPSWLAPEYCDPEQYPDLAGCGSTANDMFGVGAILLFILSGVRINQWAERVPGAPNRDEDGEGAGWSLHFERVYWETLDRLKGETPQPLWDVVRETLDPSPDQRLTLMGMREALDRVGNIRGRFLPAEVHKRSAPPTGFGPEVVAAFNQLNYKIDQKGLT